MHKKKVMQIPLKFEELVSKTTEFEKTHKKNRVKTREAEVSNENTLVEYYGHKFHRCHLTQWI